MILGNDVKQANGEVISFCKRYSRNDKLVEFLVMFTKNRVPMGKIYDLFNKDIYTDLSYIECYWMIKGIKEFYTNLNPIVTQNYKIQLSDFLHFYKPQHLFTEIEIQNAEAFYIKKVKTNTIAIPNVNQVDENLFSSFKIPFNVIAEMFNNGIVNYNFEAQREATVVDVKLGELLRKPTIYQGHVDDIKYNITKNTFFTNHVVFNILDNGEQLFEYDERNRTLKFTRTPYSQMNILDGFHRCSAITELVNQSPDREIEGYIQANIFMLNIDQAQDYIIQESKASPVAPAHTKEMRKTIANDIIKNINKKGSEDTNKMFGKIGSNVDEIKKFHTKYADINDLSKMMEELFDQEILKQTKVKRDLITELSDVFSYWIDLNTSEFNKMYDNKRYYSSNFKVRSHMFAALIYIYYKYFHEKKTDKIFEDLERINRDLDMISYDEGKILFRSTFSKNLICRLIDKYIDWNKYLPA